jgi:hypothetical protein
MPLGKPRRRWTDNVKMDFREVAKDGDWWRAREHGNEPLLLHKMVEMSRGASEEGLSSVESVSGRKQLTGTCGLHRKQGRFCVQCHIAKPARTVTFCLHWRYG